MSITRSESPLAAAPSQPLAAPPVGDALQDQAIATLERLKAEGRLTPKKAAQTAAQAIEKMLEQKSTSRKTALLNLKELTDSALNRRYAESGKNEIHSILLTALHSIRRKRQGEKALRHLVRHNRHFAALEPSERWRFFIDGHRQESGNLYEFDDEPGYYGAMCHGLALILSAPGEDMTSDMYEKLHDTCVSEVGRLGRRMTRMPPKDEIKIKSIRTKYRNEINEGGVPIAFSLILAEELSGNPNATELGVRELKRKFKGDGWCEVNDDSIMPNRETKKKPEAVCYRKATQLECAQRVDQTFAHYRHNIAQAKDGTSRREVILECCQTLSQLHVFQDGNIRTINLVMNKLLMANDLSPAIMDNPNVLDAFDMPALMQELQKGQDNFQRLCRPPSQPAPEHGRQV